MTTRWFSWFWFRVCCTHSPHFWTLPIECKCRTMMECSQFITFSNSRIHGRGSLWINVFKRSSSNPEGLPERGVSLMSKRSCFKRENHFLAVLCPMVLFPYTTQMFRPPQLLSPLYWTQREEYVGNVPISPLGSSFSSIYRSIHSLQRTKFHYANPTQQLNFK